MMRIMHRVAVLVIALATACGPIAYVHQVTMTADDAVEQARAAQAEKWSPYYWTRAITYLHMAREVAAHADYQGANRFGRLATEAAIKAKEEGELGQTNPSKLPYLHLEVDKDKVAPAKDKAPDVAPAKDAP
jgi:hypothetical protein